MEYNNIFESRTLIEQQIASSFEQVKHQIINHEHSKAFETLRQLINDTNSDLTKQVYIVQSRFNKWKSDDIKGFDPPTSDLNKIVSDLLDLTEIIEESVNGESSEIEIFVDLEKTVKSFQQKIDELILKPEKYFPQTISLKGKICIALLPQLSGTIKTIGKIIHELKLEFSIGQITFTIDSAGNEYHSFTLDGILDRDIEALNGLRDSLTEYGKLSSPPLIPTYPSKGNKKVSDEKSIYEDLSDNDQIDDKSKKSKLK